MSSAYRAQLHIRAEAALKGLIVHNSRRVARELALKVLFQVDVGKQPIAEVLEGAQDQIRTLSDSAVSQVAHDSQATLRKYTAERLKHLADKVSAQSVRQIKAVGTSMTTEIRSLAARASELAAAFCATPSESSADSAITDFTDAANSARAAIQRLKSRDSSCPEILEWLGDATLKSVENMEAVFAKNMPVLETTASFMLRMVHGTTEKRDEIDACLAALSTGWALDRQAAVDRNIMRLAAYELLFEPGIPAGASINEAVELAKKYSTAESGRFVNGVLGAIAGTGEAAGPDEPGEPDDDSDTQQPESGQRAGIE